MFRIKICGITTADDALLAAEAGADAIGLNFYEKSPRYIDASRAADIVDRLREDYAPEQVQVFALFVNSSLDEILWTIRDANLYGVERGVGIQLHGDEPPELIRELFQQGLGRAGELLQVLGHVPIVPLIRAFRCSDVVRRSPDPAHIAYDFAIHGAYLDRCQQLGTVPQAVLIDAHIPGSFGGTGQTVDWQAVFQHRSKLAGLPIVLAGGLTPANVAQAIRIAHPDAVDVTSGVESSPGRKDPAKVLAFVATAKKSFQALDAQCT